MMYRAARTERMRGSFSFGLPTTLNLDVRTTQQCALK